MFCAPMANFEEFFGIYGWSYWHLGNNLGKHNITLICRVKKY